MSQHLLSLFALSLVLCACTALLSKTQCSWTDDTFGVTFNLYQLQISQGGQISYYSVEDKTGNELDGGDIYTYYFNLCAPVLEYPDLICNKPSDDEYYTYCPAQYINTSTQTCSLASEERPKIMNKTYAYQLKSDKSLCYPLSSTETDAFEYSLLDEEGLDPTQGLSVRFKDGAWADSPCGRNRELTLHLKCDDDVSSVPKSYEVYEYDHCKYTITVHTIHACPVGCTTFANSLCAGQGLCGYDYTTNASRCFCYHGFFGSACEQEDTLSLLYPIEKKSENVGTDHVQTFHVTQPMTDPLSGHVVNKVVNVTYDLSMAYSSSTVYAINDTENGFEYYFNIGGTVQSSLLPVVCREVLWPCASASNKSFCQSTAVPRSIGDAGFAFRVAKNPAPAGNDTCILLGMSPFADYTPTDTEAYNPAGGLKVVYSNGSYSATDSVEGKIVNCALTIDLVCPDSRSTFVQTSAAATTNGVTMVDAATVRSVDGACVFSTTYETPLACPYNCITSADKDGHRVCNGHGMCVADPMAGFVRCVCDARYRGDYCETVVVSSDGTATSVERHSHAGFAVALLFLSILLVGFVAGVVYLYMRNKRLEKYAVPILDEYDQEHIEPRVPDYSDSDSEHFHKRPKIGGVFKKSRTENKGRTTRGQNEMVTVATSLNQTSADKKYNIANELSDEEDEDEHAPYLAARTNDDESDDDDSDEE